MQRLFFKRLLIVPLLATLLSLSLIALSPGTAFATGSPSSDGHNSGHHHHHHDDGSNASDGDDSHAGTITLDKQALGEAVRAGQELLYALTLTNTSPAGTSPLHDILVYDALPPQLTGVVVQPILLFSPITGGDGGCVVEDDPLAVGCIIDRLDAGAVAKILFTARVDPSAEPNQTITNTAIAQTDPSPPSATATETTDIVSTPSPTPTDIPVIEPPTDPIGLAILGAEIVACAVSGDASSDPCRSVIAKGFGAALRFIFPSPLPDA